MPERGCVNHSLFSVFINSSLLKFTDYTVIIPANSILGQLELPYDAYDIYGATLVYFDSIYNRKTNISINGKNVVLTISSDDISTADLAFYVRILHK